MKYVKQFSIILSICLVAELLEELIPLPVAASIYGLILMLVGLMTKLIPLEKVEEAADFLVEIMPIMFIPPTVGIMTSVDALKEMLIPLTVISVVSTVLIMGVTGRVSQGILRRQIAAGGASAEDGEPAEDEDRTEDEKLSKSEDRTDGKVQVEKEEV